MRHLNRILEAVYLKPWAITPSAFHSLTAVLTKAINSRAAFELPADLPKAKPFETFGKVAVVPVCGYILNKASDLEAFCGAVSLQAFRRTLAELAANPSVESVILSIDSGGGQVKGTPEAAEAIRELKKVKNVIAYTDGTAASAAYWLACQAARVFLSESAEVGSIGVYCAYIDESRAYENAGYSVELYKGNNAEFKAMGFPGLSLTEAQREELQKSVDKSFDEFKNAVATARSGVSEEVFSAKVYEGPEAVRVGLADGVVNSLDSLIAYLNR